MKGNTVFKGAYNRCLHLLDDMEVGDVLPSHSELASRLAVSRTTVRSVLPALVEAGIVEADGGQHVLRRKPEPDQRFPEGQTLSAGETVEQRFMQSILKGEFQAGQILSSSELARELDTSTTTIREYLNHFQRFGLIERRPNSGWIYLGVTSNFAADIYEVREMFELRAARHLIERPADDPCWDDLDRLERRHLDILGEIDARYGEFPELDERLHRFIHDISGNRYIRDFYNVVSTIFHYNYMWNRDDEKQRTVTALKEHLAYIDALRSRDVRRIEAAFLDHMATARSKLLHSIENGPFKVPN